MKKIIDWIASKLFPEGSFGGTGGLSLRKKKKKK